MNVQITLTARIPGEDIAWNQWLITQAIDHRLEEFLLYRYDTRIKITSINIKEIQPGSAP